MSISLAVLEDVVREAGTIALAYFKDLKNVEVRPRRAQLLRIAPYGTNPK